MQIANARQVLATAQLFLNVGINLRRAILPSQNCSAGGQLTGSKLLADEHEGRRYSCVVRREDNIPLHR